MPRAKAKKAKCRGKPLDTIITMLKRPNGATREEILRAIGWKSISMQNVTTRAGFKLRVNEFERPYKYKVVGDRLRKEMQ